MAVLIDGIIGARPNLMKMAPQANLEVGSGSQAEQTARILSGYDAFLERSGPKPRGVLVVGDVNSTLACSLVAAKRGIPIAHVEAGLRSGDRRMPEEINRIVTDALSELLFVSDPEGLKHLEREGRPMDRCWLVGPQGYYDSLRLIRDAKAVLTDSGGIQEEAAVLEVPCLTLRWNTERPITVERGTSELVGNDPRRILDGWRRIRSGRWKSAAGIPLWDGGAAPRIVRYLKKNWGRT